MVTRSADADGAKPLRVDARGMRCPWPVLRAARAMREGGDCEILADDPKAEGEIAALAAAHGWHMDAVPGGWRLRQTVPD